MQSICRIICMLPNAHFRAADSWIMLILLLKCMHKRPAPSPVRAWGARAMQSPRASRGAPGSKTTKFIAFSVCLAIMSLCHAGASSLKRRCRPAGSFDVSSCVSQLRRSLITGLVVHRTLLQHSTQTHLDPFDFAGRLARAPYSSPCTVHLRTNKIIP